MRTSLISTLVALGAVPTLAVAALTYDVPAGWTPKTPSSSMRVAEFTLARVAGDAEDASVTVFFFGASQGGNVQANIDRWVGQMAQPDGRSSNEIAKTTTAAAASGLKLSLVDVTGTHVAEVAPGSAEHFNKPGFRQIAVYVETPGGPYFVKCLGPAATVARWHESLQTFLHSLKYQ